MRKKIFWMAVFTFFTMLMTGIYLPARQQSKSKPGSATQVKAAAGVPSIMTVSMHVHDIDDQDQDPTRDHASDNDHCIIFDPEPSPSQSPTPTPTPLKVDVVFSEAPKVNLQMNITMFYTNPKHITPNDKQLRAERLSAPCQPNPQDSTACTTSFDEKSVIPPKLAGGPRHPAWHLGDQPDGTYLADGSLSPTMEAGKTSAGPQRLTNSKKVPGLPDENFFYAFRNPSKCDALPLSKPKSR